jgi:ABC-type bacteriocin/lantibiotic exporter with double-glycine peptidase domain
MANQSKIFSSVLKIVRHDKKNVVYLIYYSAIKAILALSIPLASSFIINSVLAHASISVFILGFIVITTFVFITFLKVTQEYIVEKFQQEIFVQTGIEVADLASNLSKKKLDTKLSCHTDQYMNYFFDITSLQKLFPVLLLDGVGLVIKIVVSLILLLAFSPLLFVSAAILFAVYLVLILLLGHNGIKYAIERSDAKHKSIYFLQHIPDMNRSRDEILKQCDRHLNDYVDSRQKSFGVIIKQYAFTFFMEGLILSGFLILGGYLVINGSLPIGEFVAAEIVIVSIIYSLKVFVKQIDYIYEMIEGVSKLNKLSMSLSEKEHE